MSATKNGFGVQPLNVQYNDLQNNRQLQQAMNQQRVIKNPAQRLNQMQIQNVVKQ